MIIMSRQVVMDDDVWNELTNIKYRDKNKTLSDVVRILILKVQKMDNKK
jgi:predicted CopG family antitoxin